MSKTNLVKKYIQNEAQAGRFKAGQRLPSCRELAALLAVNKLTVNRAYKELEREHKVYSVARGGYYLVDSVEQGPPPYQEADFQSVRPETKLIPYREFTHAINKAVEMYKRDLFHYSPPAGFLPLRQTLKNQLEKDGIYTSPENIIITHGAQQAISLLLLVLSRYKKRRKLLVEAPTYSLVLEMAKSLGVPVKGIERTSQGFNFRELESQFSSGEFAAFYVIPRHHNPTGYTLSEQDKQALAQLASKYDVQIIEDDYLADLGSRKGSLPIHYYDISKRTAYIRSFSKTFMPGLRIGAAVLDESLLKEVANLKHLSDLNTSGLHQAALNVFMKSGMYEKHIKKARTVYTAKLKKAKEIFQALSPPNLGWHVPRHGMFIWLQTTQNAPAVTYKLQQKGIRVQPAADSFPEDWIQSTQSPTRKNVFASALPELLRKTSTVWPVFWRNCRTAYLTGGMITPSSLGFKNKPIQNRP